MPALSCLCCSACFLDAVGPRGWRDGRGRAGGEMHRYGDRVAGLGRRSARAGRKARSAGPQAAAGTSEMTGGRMRQAGQACAAGRKARPAGPHAAVAGRKARSAGPHAAAAERPRGAGNTFAPCVISGSSTRKRALGGKIRAPCIPNRPIAPGNGCMGRGCCHLDLEKHAFRADVARKGAFFAHSAKKGCIRRGSCQPGPWGRRNARGGRGRRRAVGAMGAMRAELPDGNDLDDDSGSAR